MHRLLSVFYASAVVGKSNEEKVVFLTKKRKFFKDCDPANLQLEPETDDPATDK